MKSIRIFFVSSQKITCDVSMAAAAQSHVMFPWQRRRPHASPGVECLKVLSV